MWGVLQTYISDFETFCICGNEYILSVVFTSLILLEFFLKKSSFTKTHFANLGLFTC
jgi:hypothetical protein